MSSRKCWRGMPAWPAGCGQLHLLFRERLEQGAPSPHRAGTLANTNPPRAVARFPYLLMFHTDLRMTSVLALVHERREPQRTFVTLARRQAEF